MIKFTKAIELKKNGSLCKELKNNLFLVKESFLWYLDYENKREFVLVEKGFRTDLSSIPKPLRIFFNTNRTAGILHDKLFTDKIIWYYHKPTMLSKKQLKHRKCGFFEANYIYYLALKIDGASKIEAILQFIGLCLFGWIIFYFIKK